MDDESRNRGFRPIGSLASEELRSLTLRDETTPGSGERGQPAEISTSARETSLPTTTRPGAPGSITRHDLSLSEALRTNDPEAVDRAILASLPPSVASTLKPTYREYIDPKYGFDCEFTGYAMPPDVIVPIGDLVKAASLVERHLRPAPEPLIKQELARLRVSTKARAESDDDLAMGFQVLAEECSEYPADVVVWALRSWARMETFYPSLAEIRERLQRGVARRRAMAKAL
jgi:hypothetical protein